MRRSIVAVSTALLLAAPAVAAAKGGPHKDKVRGPKLQSFVLKGTYAGDSAVAVTKANGPGKKAGLVGQTLTIDFAAARVVVDDVNADGVRDLADVAVGDKVVVKVKAPKGATSFAARQLVDQTHKAHADDDAPDATEAPEAPHTETD